MSWLKAESLVFSAAWANCTSSCRHLGSTVARVLLLPPSSNKHLARYAHNTDLTITQSHLFMRWPHFHLLLSALQTDAKKVYVVGHSLGGAMAAIAALRLNYLLKNTDTGAEVGGVWLFGCPRIGNQAWQDEYHRRLLTKTLRMANFGDFASRLPMQTQICPSAARILSNFEFRHVGRSVVLCPESATGLTNWRLSAEGSETLDCAHRDPSDLTLTTHWLGPYLDAWRRAHATAYPMNIRKTPHLTANVTMEATNGTTLAMLQSVNLATDPCITSIMCEECSLSFPNDRNKQLNVPARAGGPIGCCTSASCSMQSAWDAVATIGAQITRTFNPLSVCSGYICT